MSKAMVVASGLVLSACAWASPVDGYWANLEALCGQAFEGRLIAAPDDAMAGQRLVMHVRECGAERIRIPFVIGDNLSRTWVLTRHGHRIELRHDHRHPDGSPEDITLYGGRSPNRGSDRLQIFPADDQTLDTLPDNVPNVWLMQIEPGERFTYHVRRLATERYYHFEFDLTEPVEPPPAPWGWED